MNRLFVVRCLAPLLAVAAWADGFCSVEQRTAAHGPEVVMRDVAAAATWPARYDVVITGAGTGGTAAAIQAARLGASVLLLEESDWIGGQMNAAAVTSMDEGGRLVRERGIYHEFCERVEAHYRTLGKTAETAYFFHSICLEPHVGQQILGAMIEEARKTAPLDVALRTTVTEVLRSGNTVTGVVVQAGTARRSVACRLLIDATEWGDVIPLTGARYRVGNCTSDSIQPERRIQDLTWTAVIRQYPHGVPAALLLANVPPGYTAKIHERFVKTLQAGDTVQGRPFDPKTRPWNFTTFIGYRGMPDSASAQDAPPITRTHMNFNNDYEVCVRDVEDPASRRQTCRAAQLRTLQLLYYLQHTLGKTDWSVADDEGFDTPYRRAQVEAWIHDAPELASYRAVLNHFSIMAYARESRRIIGLHTLTAREIERHPGTPTQFPTAVALGDYGIDLHGSMTPRLLEPDLDRPEDMPSETLKRGTGPFAIPFESFIPAKLDGFLAAEKNISQSRLANGATRLQPSTMLMGQAAGAIAALALKYNVPPRRLDPVCVQHVLLAAGSTLFITPFRDVARESPEWPAIQLTAVHGLLLPEQGRFGPDKPVSAAQFHELRKRLFAQDTATGTEPVARAAFAAALQSGLAGTPLKLEFTSSAADQVRAITRSEAAQVLAELLELRAMARMTGAAQTLVWKSLRPTTPPPAIDVGSTLPHDLQRLLAYNIMDATDYWLEHAVTGGQCDGAQVAALVARAALALEPSATAQPPVEILARHGVMSTPAYWIQHARPGQRCGGSTVAALLANLARQLPQRATHDSGEQRTAAPGPEVGLRDRASVTNAAGNPADDTARLRQLLAAGGAVTISPGDYFVGAGEPLPLASRMSVEAQGARFHLPEKLGDKARVVVFAGTNVTDFSWHGGEFFGHVFDPARQENPWEPNANTRVFVIATTPGGTTSNITFRDVQSHDIAGAVINITGALPPRGEREVLTYARGVRIADCTLLRSGKFMWDYGYLWQQLVWPEDYAPWEVARARRYFRTDLIRDGVQLSDGDDRVRFDNRTKPIKVSTKDLPNYALCFFGDTLPKNIVRGRQYFVVASAPDHLQVAEQSGGVPIRFAGAGGAGVKLIHNLAAAIPALFAPTGAGPGKGGVDVVGCRDVSITGCTLSALGDTMHLQRCCDAVFSHNHITGSRMGAFFIAEYCQRVTAASNTVDGTNGSRVMSVEKSATDIAIIGNTFCNGGRGSWINQPHNLLLQGNTFSNNTTKCAHDPRRGRRSFATGGWEQYAEMYFTTYEPGGRYGNIVIRDNLFVTGPEATHAITFAPGGDNILVTGNTFRGSVRTIPDAAGCTNVILQANPGLSRSRRGAVE